MSPRISDVLDAFVLAASLVACGSTTETPGPADASGGGAGGAPNEDARTDANGGAPTSDAQPDNVPGDACGGEVAWTAASLTFTLTSTGGFVAPPPPEAGCTTVGSTYDFSLPAATLEEQGCNVTGRHDSLVHLSPSEVDAVVAAVGAIRTTCVKSCGADAPSTKLTVRASGVETTYTSNFYAGCPSPMDTPPFVAFEALFQLENSLGQIVSQACRSDAGSADASTCVTR